MLIIVHFYFARRVIQNWLYSYKYVYIYIFFNKNIVPLRVSRAVLWTFKKKNQIVQIIAYVFRSHFPYMVPPLSLSTYDGRTKGSDSVRERERKRLIDWSIERERYRSRSHKSKMYMKREIRVYAVCPSFLWSLFFWLGHQEGECTRGKEMVYRGLKQNNVEAFFREHEDER